MGHAKFKLVEPRHVATARRGPVLSAQPVFAAFAFVPALPLFFLLCLPLDSLGRSKPLLKTTLALIIL